MLTRSRFCFFPFPRKSRFPPLISSSRRDKDFLFLLPSSTRFPKSLGKTKIIKKLRFFRIFRGNDQLRVFASSFSLEVELERRLKSTQGSSFACFLLITLDLDSKKDVLKSRCSWSNIQITLLVVHCVHSGKVERGNDFCQRLSNLLGILLIKYSYSSRKFSSFAF